jgi:DNA-binding XRE family transcriptional regulator
MIARDTVMDTFQPVLDRDTVQVVKTPAGEEFVFLPKKDFDALVEALEEAREDLEDIAAYDAARAEIDAAQLPPFPPEVNAGLMRGDRRLAAIRKWRDVSVAQLAAKSGVSDTDIAAFEAGEREQTVGQANALAAALDVHPGWLEP